MRIAFICGAGLVGGKERQTLASMIQLKNEGHEVFCVTSSWGTSEFTDLLLGNDIAFIKIRIGFISKTINLSSVRMTLHQLLYIPSLWWRYRKALKIFKPQFVIHTNFHHLFLLSPVLGSAKQIFYVHDYFSPAPFYCRLFSFFNRRIDLFIGVSKFITESLTQLGISRVKVDLVYNGISAPIREPAAIVESTSFKIGIIGQIGEWKGHHVLIKALAPILRENRNIELHVIGDGGEVYVNSVVALIEEEEIRDQVIFRGRIFELTEIYKCLSIVCVPSLINESFGLAAIEPGFFSIPVICSDLGALPELVENHVSGLVVSANNIDALRESIHQLLDHPQQRLAMGAAAKKRSNELFTIQQSTSNLINTLNRL